MYAVIIFRSQTHPATLRTPYQSRSTLSGPAVMTTASRHGGRLIPVECDVHGSPDTTQIHERMTFYRTFGSEKL